jgi:hypothetical protein
MSSSGVEVAHGSDCVAIMRQRDGRRWGEVLTPDEADELAERLHEQAAAARQTAKCPD